MIRNPYVVSVCPKARNSHVISDYQPSNLPAPEPAGTNTHYSRIRHQCRDNFKLREDVKHFMTTEDIRTRVRIDVLTTSRLLAHHPVVIMNYLLNRISLIWTPDLFLLYDYIFIYWTHRWNLEKMKMGVFKILPKILVVC